MEGSKGKETTDLQNSIDRLVIMKGVVAERQWIIRWAHNTVVYKDVEKDRLDDIWLRSQQENGTTVEFIFIRCYQ